MASRDRHLLPSAARKTSSACASVAEGLLDDDVLATGDAGKGLLVVKCVRAADIDGVDVGGCRELIE